MRAALRSLDMEDQEMASKPTKKIRTILDEIPREKILDNIKTGKSALGHIKEGYVLDQ